MSPENRPRRTFLRGFVLGSALMTVGTVGCVSTDGSDGGRGEYDDTPFVETEPDYDGWFESVDNYEGTLDLNDAESVRIGVGAGGGLSFSPPAVRVTPSTEVVWEWTGRGGEHNVVEERNEFGSRLVNEAGYRFRHVFESPGIYRYLCEPHSRLGMRGAICVRRSDASSDLVADER